jgi:hypothetical protein
MNEIQSVTPVNPPSSVLTRRRGISRRPGRSPSLLRKSVATLAFLPLALSLVTDLPVFWFTRVLAASLWVLCLVPSFMYLRQPQAIRRPIPFFPLISLIYGIYYMLPLTLGIVDNYYNAPVFVQSDYDYPVQLAFLGWIAMVLGYLAVGVFLRQRRPPTQIRWDPKIVAKIGFLLMGAGMAAAGLRVFFLSAIVVGGLFQFLLGLQWVGTGLLIILARRRELTTIQRWLLTGAFFLSSAMMLANGSIAPMLMLFVVAGFAVWIGRPEIRTGWIVAAVFALLTVSSFRGIAIEFRRATSAQNIQLSQSENLRLMVTLLSRRMSEQGVFGAITHGLATTAGRSANLDLFANVVRRTPSEVPYWEGGTYKSLVGSAIPRILWPNKPVKELGQEFGHRYNFLHATNLSTSINLPVLVEFYANFGGTGVMVGMLIVGIIYRVLDGLVNRPRQSPILSMIGVAVMMPLLFIESDFSLIFGGLPLSGLAFYVVWNRVHKMLGLPRSYARRVPFRQFAVAGATLESPERS